MNKSREENKHGVFFDLRGFLIGCVIVALCLPYAIDYYHRQGTHTVSDAIEAIIACADKPDAIACVRPYVKLVLEKESGAQALDDLSVRLNPLQCHYIGHVVGQELYRKIGNIESALTQCNRACDSACVHGVIGQAFVEELGLGSTDDVSFDPEHLTAEEILRIGKGLCKTPRTCHGVGHVLFQAYGTFDPAIAACQSVSSGDTLSYCYSGIFMEWADVITARNIRPVSGVKYPEVSQLRSLCTDTSSKYEVKTPCFRYFPRVVLSTLIKNGFSQTEADKKLKEICLSYTDTVDRATCVVGMGHNASNSLVTDPVGATKFCLSFTFLGDRAACNMGQVSATTGDRVEKVIAYCAAVPEEVLRHDCYQEVFYYIHYLGDSIRTEVCNGDALCLTGAKNYMNDPYRQLQGRYH